MQEKNLWFVIQGPMDFYDDVKNSYNGFSNVIWSTWKNEKSKIEHEKYYILNNPPFCPGKQNINYQIRSTMAGLKYAKKLGAKYVFKIRSDIAFDNLGLLLSKLKFDNTLYFPAYCYLENGYLIDYFQFGPIDKMLQLWNMPLKFEKLHKKYPEYYLTQNFISKFKNEEIRYIIPILKEHGLSYCWFKHPENYTVIKNSPNTFGYRYLFNKEI